ncbi:MAG: glycosyltransferase family 4 protein [Desulfamplus sp.]|nr:glycosyltransferase family 4 protein [Desulfamplus sp.]
MQSRLKIGLISYRSNPHCGGQGVYVRNLAQALSDLGHNVEVIAGPPDPLLVGDVKLTMLQNLDLYNPNDLFRTPKLHELVDPINLVEWLGVSSMGYPEPLTFGMRAKRYLKENKFRGYDIIHDNQSLSYGILSISKHLPVTATIHHPMTVDRRIAVKSTRSIVQKFKQIRWYSFIGMQKYVARRLSKIVTVSEFSKQDISREFAIPKERFITIPNGINTELFRPLEQIKRESNRIIVTNSADTPLKGLYYLLHAIKAVSKERPVKLIVIGSPKKDGKVERLVKNLELKEIVDFTGRVDERRFIEEYAKATIAVVPSLYEGFGLPVGEAMACKIPVICTTGGALPEVAGDAAEIVPTENSNALKDAIISLLDSPAKREKMAQAGYDRVMKNYTWQATAIKTVQAYREVINSYKK